MSSQFERDRTPQGQSGIIFRLFDPDEGISPEDAGRDDAREAMAAAKHILRDAAIRMKLPVGA